MAWEYYYVQYSIVLQYIIVQQNIMQLTSMTVLSYFTYMYDQVLHVLALLLLYGFDNKICMVSISSTRVCMGSFLSGFLQHSKNIVVN